MAWEDMEKVLGNCLAMAERFNRLPNFFITGGDPLLHPDFWRLLSLLKKDGICFSILGNPFHLDDGVCARLKEHGCEKYQLSLDGLEKTHDWFRKPGSYKATHKALAMLKKAGVEAAVMATVSSANLAEIPALYKACIDCGADIFAFARYCPPGFANDLDPLKYRQMMRDCLEIERANPDSATWLSRKDHLWTLLDWEEGRFEIPEDALPDMIYDGCNCGNCHLTILADGSVLACRRMPQSHVGNALRDSLSDIWLNEMEKYRDFDKFEKCGDCGIKAWCRGCPAVAASPGGDFYAPDPQCWKKQSQASY